MSWLPDPLYREGLVWTQVKAQQPAVPGHDPCTQRTWTQLESSLLALGIPCSPGSSLATVHNLIVLVVLVALLWVHPCGGSGSQGKLGTLTSSCSVARSLKPRLFPQMTGNSLVLYGDWKPEGKKVGGGPWHPFLSIIFPLRERPGYKVVWKAHSIL